jgi:endoribonuclease LACTB2
VLRKDNFPRQIISDVILSHRHHDHHKGLPSVLNLLRRLWGEFSPSSHGNYLPPRVHKYALPGDSSDESLAATLAALKPGTFVENRTRSPPSPLHDLRDLQIIHGNGASLNIYHTPGHTDDSVCVYLPQDEAIFTADTVLGQGTAVFENLALYIKSLQRLLSSENGIIAGTLYPGHGPVVDEGRKTIEMYIRHRLEREEQIVSLLRRPPPKDYIAWRIMDIVPILYKDYPETLWPAAAHGVRLHLDKLEGEGRVNMVEMGSEEGWQLLDK